MSHRITIAISVWILLTTPCFGQLQSFSVKFVSNGVVYINGGSGAGIQEGMHLTIRRPGPGQVPLMAPPIAEMVVIAVATASASCEILSAETPVQVGDLAFGEQADLKPEASSRQPEIYAQIVEFSEENPIEEEVRASIPKPPLPEINRFRGRIGIDEDYIFDHSDLGLSSHRQGLAFRFNFTRIGSTHWSLEGYWRARLNSRDRPAGQEPLTDVLQRVYHFGLRYSSPDSRYVAGFGRLLVPWASSLSTLDGGYFGRKIGHSVTAGIFAGTTPDPTAWDYDPNRQLGGTFMNLEAGEFNTARYSLTTGVALSRLGGRPERQFLFVENGILIGRKLSFHHNLEADYKSAANFASPDTLSLTRSFLTMRVQPVSHVSLDFSHNYFRVLPTVDPRLISTGLLDKILFQGFNAGARIDFPLGFTAYGTAGQSRRTQDTSPSWNRMGGLIARIPGTGLRADARYSYFTSTVATGIYRSVSVRRDISELWRFEIEAGNQRLTSGLVNASSSWYGTGNVDFFIDHFVLSFRGTRYQGGSQNYDQIRAGLDIRF